MNRHSAARRAHKRNAAIEVSVRNYTGRLQRAVAFLSDDNVVVAAICVNIGAAEFRTDIRAGRVSVRRPRKWR